MNKIEQIPTHVIIRTFEADGVTLHPGQQVDASGWPNVMKLEDSGYLRPLHSKNTMENVVKALLDLQKKKE